MLMKTIRLLSLLATCVLSLSLYAYDFQSAGVCYKVTSPTTVAVTYKDLSSLNNYPYLIDVIIPSKVTYNDIEYDVTSIADSAFCYSNDLASFTIPEGVTSIGTRAFYSSLGLGAVTIPSGVTSIGEGAFGYTNLTSVTIPTGVTSIAKNLFLCCSSLTSVTLPEGITSIGEQAFGSCESLASITIPDGVTSIGRAAFADTGLTSFTIPETVTTINEYTFYECKALTSIAFPANVTTIDDAAFSGCDGLTSISVAAMTPPTIQYGTFESVSRTIPLYVPTGTLYAYSVADYWSEFINISATLPTAIQPVVALEGVYAQNGTVVVENGTNLPVSIYDVTGRLVVSGSSLSQYFAVPTVGVYLVKVGEQTMKLLVP